MKTPQTISFLILYFFATSFLLAQTPNEFIGSFNMEIVQKNSDNSTDGTPFSINVYVKEFQTAIEPISSETQGMIMIFDKRDQSTTMKMNQGGTKMANKMIMPKIDIDQKGKYDESNYTATKTEDRRTIANFSCVKYLIETDESSTIAWITEDLEINYEMLSSFFSMKGKAGGPSGKQPNYLGVEGIALESHTTDKNTGEVVDMYIKKIVKGKVPSEPFDLEGFQVNDLTKFMKN